MIKNESSVKSLSREHRAQCIVKYYYTIAWYIIIHSGTRWLTVPKYEPLTCDRIMDSIYSVFLLGNNNRTRTESATLFANAMVLNTFNFQLVLCMLSLVINWQKGKQTVVQIWDKLRWCFKIPVVIRPWLFEERSGLLNHQAS